LTSLNGGTTMSPSLLDVIGKTLGSAASTNPHPQVVKVQARTSSSPPSPQMGGQGQTSGPDGTTNQWHWFANPRERLVPVFFSSWPRTVYAQSHASCSSLVSPPAESTASTCRGGNDSHCTDRNEQSGCYGFRHPSAAPAR
jgi:hypothetical protein